VDGGSAAAAALAAAGLALSLSTAPVVPAAAPGALARHADAPPAGHTGGFGEPTCRECHDEFELNVNGSLTVGGLPATYRSGETYTVTLVLESEGMARAGFQGAFRYASGARVGTSAGSLTPIGETVVVRTEGDGPTRVQHAPGALWTDGATASWSFAWTAPTTGGDPVALHVAVNSANGDDSPFGDIVYALADTVAGPGEPTSRRPEDPWRK
jgi:hypothetical protein